MASKKEVSLKGSLPGGNSGSGLNNSSSNLAGGGSNSGANVTKAPSKGVSKTGNVNFVFSCPFFFPISILTYLPLSP